MQQAFSGGTILQAINSIRSNPGSIIDELKTQLNKFETNHVYRSKNGNKVRTQSGKQAWQDAIMSVERQKSKNPLLWSKHLQNAANAYKDMVVQGQSDVNPFDVIKSVCAYDGSITFNINESDIDQEIKELMASMVVGDDDEKKAARVAIFHPLYKVYGCAVLNKGGKMVIYSIFSENAREAEEKSVSPSKPESVVSKSSSASWQTNGFSQISQSVSQNKGNQKFIKELSDDDCLKRGRDFIAQLNKIRKDPKNYIHALKAQISKFKDQKTLVTDYGTIILQQGQTPYYDFISELQTQYPLPSVREVLSLSLTALEQIKQYEKIHQKDRRTQFEVLLAKYTSQPQNIKSYKLKDITNWPMSAIVMGLLLSDGDKKRTIRRKLMSPINKAIGCCINNNLAIVNVGQSAKDRKDLPMEGLGNFNVNPSSQKSSQISFNQQSPTKIHFIKEDDQHKISYGKNGKVIVKKTSKSRQQQIKGRQYKITEIKITYQNGETQQIVEQQLIQ